jgi:glycosyltransferase involved in cell wall biosynthesis
VIQGSALLRRLRFPVYLLVDLTLLVPLLASALLSRLAVRPYDVGLGPEPLVNHVHHKRALEQRHYRVRTFVNHTYYVTENFDWKLRFPPGLNYLTYPLLFLAACWRFRCLYFSFRGGPLGATVLLWRLEPFFYGVAGVKTVVMPYGSDVQNLLHTPNLLLRDAIARDYPLHRHARRRTAARLDLWTRRADHVIAGCDWVDYLYHWDTLLLAHFSIDTDEWKPAGAPMTTNAVRPLRVLHAPNHRAIKGTEHFVRAVEELRQEGVAIELVIAERVPNERIRELIFQSDVVADQLVIGWYALFALEAMALEKPVLCYIRADLRRFYIDAGLLREDELPVVDCSIASVKDVLRRLALARDTLPALGRRGREFVLRHHSLEAIGAAFDRINRSLSLAPSGDGA